VVAALATPLAPSAIWTITGLFKALSSRFGGDAEPLDEEVIQRLVVRARTGERDAAQRLYRQHVDRVFRTVRGMLRSDAEAEDVTQDAMLTVLTSLDRYSPRSDARFIAWVTSVAANTARRRFRRRRPELTGTGELPDVADQQAQPEQDLDAAREIARIVELEPGNVRKILERTRAKLGARIEALLKREGAIV
jgi:DNA-directed RNA polymerase specialized sigma24 family protein